MTITQCYKLNRFYVNMCGFCTIVIVHYCYIFYVHMVTKTVLFDALSTLEYNSAFIRNNYDSPDFV